MVTPGSMVTGKVSSITKFGAFVSLEDGSTGLVHISEIADCYVKEVSDFLKVGQEIKALVLKPADNGRINLSIKQALQTNAAKEKPSGSFEDMLSKFMSDSSKKMSDLNLTATQRKRPRKK